MKRILKIVVAIVSAWFIYLAAEQIYLYYHYDKQNFCIILSNQNSEEPMYVKVYIDDSLVYDTVMIHRLYWYGTRMPLSLGKHNIKIKKANSLIYESNFIMILNKCFMIDCYDDDSVSVSTTTTKPYLL